MAFLLSFSVLCALFVCFFFCFRLFPFLYLLLLNADATAAVAVATAVATIVAWAAVRCSRYIGIRISHSHQ